MQHFATAKISPWAIAWLVKVDDWGHLERIIRRNCTLLGGCHNVLIPVDSDGTISFRLQSFLQLYDPDYIFLAPGMTEFPQQELPLYPYATIRWDQVPQIVSTSTQGASGNQPAKVNFYRARERTVTELPVHDLIAVSDATLPDASRLALLACGDVLPTEYMWDSFDGDVHLHANGYREEILRRSAIDGSASIVCARLGSDDEVIPAPNRHQLASLIKDENKFPLTGAVRILEACCGMQNFPTIFRSFTGRTVPYHGGGTAFRKLSQVLFTPGMAILVSDHFGFSEAVLFWNLRAAQVLVSWISFVQLEQELPAIREWLESEIGAACYVFGQDIAFAAAGSDQHRLREIFSSLCSKKKQYPELKMVDYEGLVHYDYQRPDVVSRHVSINREENTGSFLPEYPQDCVGALALTLEWSRLMLPRQPPTADLISSDKIFIQSRLHLDSGKIDPSFELPRFRITRTRHARIQLEDNSPVQFVIPVINRVLTGLLEQAGFKQFQETSLAQYQRRFILRSGGLLRACYFLRQSPYYEFLRLMSDCSNSNLVGWLLKEKRRVLHHIDLHKALDLAIPDMTDSYLKKAASLPEEAMQLIRLQLLERGFQLSCSSCSSKLWYRAEDVGQVFTCQRCYEQQPVESNPLWLYKLPEVIFQGFHHHMEVPLLALFHLLRMARHNFEYVLDAKVSRNGTKTESNLDFSCLLNGRVYIGEAKSNDHIEEKQFGFYRTLINQTAIDGIVFATSENDWKPSTQDRIEALRSKFPGEVLVLTKSQLFNQMEPNGSGPLT